MNLNPRERKLLIALGGVVLVMAVYFLFLRGDGGGEVAVPEIFPSSGPTTIVSPDSDGAEPSGSPTFVVPVGARDPFKA